MKTFAASILTHVTLNCLYLTGGCVAPLAFLSFWPDPDAVRAIVGEVIESGLMKDASDFQYASVKVVWFNLRVSTQS